jgi:hypothetical protein
MPVRVYFGPHQADWNAEVMSDKGRQADNWYRLGVRFTDLHAKEIDLINDTVFSIVVPDSFSRLSEPGWFRRWARNARLSLTRITTRGAIRQQVQAPVRIEHATGVFVSTLRDVSESGLSLLSPVALEPGVMVRVTLSAAMRQLETLAVVVRSEARPSRETFGTWVVSLQFVQAQPSAAVEPFLQEEAA